MITKLMRVNSEFSSAMVEIYMKDNRKPFAVHQNILETKSSFFQKHKPAAKPKYHPRRRYNEDVDSVKREEEAETSVATLDESETIEVDDNDILQQGTHTTYDLTQTNFKYEVFEVFVEFVYSKPPKKIQDTKGVKIAINVYCVATMYEVEDLQNAIVDRIREYHQENAAQLTFLTNIVSRWKDHGWQNLECRLNKYLVDQIAHDISVNGYGDFTTSNSYINKWLRGDGEEGEGNSTRRDLFIAIAKIAHLGKKSKLIDPASMDKGHGCKYHVHASPVHCEGLSWRLVMD